MIEIIDRYIEIRYKEKHRNKYCEHTNKNIGITRLINLIDC